MLISENIECANCHHFIPKDDLEKHCSNCFSCTGCEIYVCPVCHQLIVIKPVGQPWRSYRADEQDSAQ